MDKVSTFDLDDVVADVVWWGGRRGIPDEEGLHLAACLVHRMLLAIGALEARGWSREAIVARLQPARELYAQSPFVKRLQEWPRGYAGDFETVEYILEQRNRATPGTLAFWLEQYALDSPIAQQHRNKVTLQARVILEAIRSAPAAAGEPRVLVLAAGGSPDLRQIQHILAGQRFQIVLVDQDAEALTFSLDRLPAIRDRVIPLTRNVVRGLRDVGRYGPFDLVVAGGLFDYLPDRMATLVLRQARTHLLGRDGRVVFTNIGDRNAYRLWIEHLAEWRLIHRSASHVRSLCVEAGFDNAGVSVTADTTGLALVVECRTHAIESAMPSDDEAVPVSFNPAVNVAADTTVLPSV